MNPQKEDTPYRCAKCGKLLRTVSIKVKHEQNCPGLNCVKCGKEFNFVRGNVHHQKTCQGKYRCLRCNVGFPNFSLLQRHKNEEHGGAFHI